MATKETIEQLFKAHYSSMYSLAHAMLRDEEEAHDVVHEIFSTLLHSRQHEEYGIGFLLRCVRNQCLNIIKRLPVRESIERHLSPENRIFFEDPDNWDETLKAVHKMIIEELPERCGEIMTLRYEEGLSYQEIAERTGISKGAVYKHLKAGIDYLRKNIKRI